MTAPPGSAAVDDDLRRRLCDAVDAAFDREVAFLADLVSQPSTRGAEAGVQTLMAEALAGRGLDVDVWRIDVDAIRDLPGFSPAPDGYEDAVNVVGTHRSRTQRGRSLILNGHVDVVPAGPAEMWASPPFTPRVADGWMYGRGAGDMKAGIASNVFALDALHAVGLAPAADVFVQSVVEEECTGNGTLACLARGYRADAALIPEPFSEALVTAQVGVIWFRVHLRGLPAHVAYAGSGANAIEAAVPLIAALHGMEARWNAPGRRHAAFAGIDHALNLNVGRIEGGDWTSSVPAWCTFDVRMAIYPGDSVARATAEIEAVLAEASAGNTLLRRIRPEVVFHGFLADGYALGDDGSDMARDAVAGLAQAHGAVTGRTLGRVPITATTDARFFGLFAGVPALVYGPRAEAIHGFDERVDLDSLRRVTKVTATFVATWCGVEDA